MVTMWGQTWQGRFFVVHRIGDLIYVYDTRTAYRMEWRQDFGCVETNIKDIFFDFRSVVIVKTKPNYGCVYRDVLKGAKHSFMLYVESSAEVAVENDLSPTEVWRKGWIIEEWNYRLLNSRKEELMLLEERRSICENITQDFALSEKYKGGHVLVPFQVGFGRTCHESEGFLVL